MRKTGISIIGEVPWGAHLCQFYQTQTDLTDMLVPYFKAGLEENEFCMWVTSPDLTTEEAEAALRRAVPDLDRRRERGQIEILPHTEWYLQGGMFDPQRVLNGWVKQLEQGLAKGFAGLRVSGNAGWLEKGVWKDFAGYEEAVNAVVGRYKIIALCTFPLAKCGVVEILDVVRTHQFALIRSQNGWEVIESSDDKRRQAEARVRRQNAILAGIAQVFQEALTCRTEEELGRVCLQVAERVTESKFGFIGKLNAQTARLDNVAMSDPGWEACRTDAPAGHDKGTPKDFAVHGIYGRVLQDGKGFFTNDPSSHPDSIGCQEGHPLLQSFLGVPLFHGGQTIGLIGLGNRPEGYGPEQLEAAEALTPAIVQAFMRKEAEDQARELQRRNKEELERLVAERTAKLQELVGELEHFSYTITHDMRAPLRAMQGFAEVMREACADCPKQEQKTFLSRIETSASRMDCLILDALNYNRIVRQELPLEPVDVEALLRGMLDSYPELQPSRAQIEVAHGMPLVIGNQAGLTQCFSNLLGNAVKFVKPGQKPQIRVRAERLDGRVRLWVEDEGIGIPRSIQGRVFDMFTRGHQGYEGTGIGLALVRKAMDRMDGKVGVESEEGKGSRFWLDLKPV